MMIILEIRRRKIFGHVLSIEIASIYCILPCLYNTVYVMSLSPKGAHSLFCRLWLLVDCLLISVCQLFELKIRISFTHNPIKINVSDAKPYVTSLLIITEFKIIYQIIQVNYCEASYTGIQLRKQFVCSIFQWKGELIVFWCKREV